ncbi:type VI secretion system Vgr family protein [Nannocystis bainbridge]|uniref:Type VI secretion system tip protein TssI/VgrG n=1 Tax=Nannocystis bainbridge TaxID=2995303 RepID=A0ABT5E6S8_9BACT|nr:type VI secretion system tip protein VgrG [Nannocystis bainbridge]MDC0721567.1 type VI secretion system tip protein TssI/VgrG [Nannocystis bainbridge]
MESELLLVARQADRSCTFEIEGLSDNFWVVRFSGSEGISALYEFHLDVVARHIEVGELVGRSALLKVVGVGEPRLVHGIILRAEYTGEMRPRAMYRITLVPQLYTLLFRTNSRIFQQMSTPDILRKVLDGAGISRRRQQFELTGSYAPRDYCVQYRETDLQFISRLMEEEGIVYYFDHAAKRHVMVISDRAGGAPLIVGEPTLPFRIDDMVRDKEHVGLFRMSEEIRPDHVTLRDFNLHQPDRLLEAEHAGAKPTFELYDFPGEFQDAGLGKRLAKSELEAAQAVKRVGRGTTDSPRLTPGFGFKLADHPRVELDGEYRVLRVNHFGEQPSTIDHTAEQELVYRGEFTCIPSSVPYRAPRATPRPQVRGVQTATVVGPAGEEVHVDEHGRVKVQFHWDREGKSDEKSSCWVRVSQAWAGNGYGAMFIPRVGHEVIVDFIEGDPDRPIVTGRVYHGNNATPYPLPDEKTKSTIKSETYTGGGFNELRFEDAKGDEQVFVHAQRDMDLTVRNDRRETVGHDEHHKVLNDRKAQVGKDEHRTVGADAMTKIGGAAHTEVVGVAHTKVGGAASASFGATVDVDVSGQTTLGIGGGLDLKIGGAQRISVMGAHSLSSLGDSNVSVTGDASTKATGTVVVEGMTLILKATTGITLQGPGGFVTIDSAGVSIEGVLLKLNSGGAALPGAAGSPASPSAPSVTAPTSPTAPTPSEQAPNG